MVQLPSLSENPTLNAQVETPIDDYELLDFGHGRKLERWGRYIVETRDSLAAGVPATKGWQADWIYVDEIGHAGQWEPTRGGLPREWSVTVAGVTVPCRLDARGRVGLRGRDLPCGRWVRERIEGCYDLEEISLLNLFGGNGFVSAQAVTAGASVVHVEADADMLSLARALAGEQSVEYVQENVMDYVEDLLRRQQRFDMIVLSAPALGRGPKGQLWDREVDLLRLVKYLSRLVTDNCLGIWLSTDGGAITWKAESLGQLLQEVLPGCTIEPFKLGVQTVDGRCMSAGVGARWFDETDFLQTGDMPLTAAQLEERLDVHMVSLGAAEEPARALAEHTRAQQDFVLRCVGMVARTSAGMAFNFVSYVCGALRVMDEAGVEAWLLSCVDIYDTRGLHPAVAAFKDVDAFASDYKARRTGLALDDVINILEAFAHGLNGRHLRVEAGEHVYTDTETLFLPPCVGLSSDCDENFQLYKAMVVHQWAQTWSGTWRIDVSEALSSYPDYAQALTCFHALETLRLDALISRELPGVYRHMQVFRKAPQENLAEAWRVAQNRLAELNASVQDSLDLLCTLIDQPLPATTPYQGVLRPADVTRVREARIETDKQQFRLGLLKIQSDVEKANATETDETSPFKLREVKSQETPDGFSYEVELDGRPMDVPDNVKGTMASILQDIGEIPEDYLQAAGDGVYYAGKIDQPSSEDVWKGTYHEEGAFIYNEWDYERQHYRKNWAVLREMDVHPTHDNFVSETLHKYRGLAMDLRRTFEALRGEDKLLKKQPYGDDVDIDALVEALADAQHGAEMTERLFTKMHKMERNIAVMFMVDMSGSTKGWINDAEREALVLLCEALETLGDRYAIYGFSGMTRKRCEVYRVKRFDEPYGDEVRARISGIRPKDYTRMGVTIRHLTSLLNEVEARTKLLITLSDGKPDDYDTYRGAYGIEDTRMALIEAKRSGIHPFCITIDTEAKDYLAHMYGPVNYAVIDEVRKLPLKVSDIYRRLTT
ncbi:Nitric oxide reductase activation protein NorD [hydrothermal vent metagenome]|uniref:Nitric oxide reductase activation protein NorD n=1 Tax=hydrothermal vent metagenome TaxID=652676 RepID=A0A3B0YGE4_9ZZZZ